MTFDNVEHAEVDGLDGDDTFFLLGSHAGMVTTIIGGLGNDTFNVLGDVTKDIVSNDLLGRSGVINILDRDNRMLTKYDVPYGATLMIQDGEPVAKGAMIYEWDPYTDPVLTDRGGKMQLIDVVEGRTVHEEVDDKTGKREMMIVDDREKQLHPHARVVDETGEVRDFILPTGAFLLVGDGQQVSPGDVLCKIPRDISKMRDITGGLPRVAELFEARKPRETAVISEIDGIVKHGGVVKGQRKIMIVPDEPGAEPRRHRGTTRGEASNHSAIEK